jgi:hypothetical protein
MFVVPVKSIEEASMPTGETEIAATPSWSWADIENILGAEWEIGGSAMPTDAIRGFVASE